MNRIHNWYCRSAHWTRTLERQVLPWALGGTDLGPDVLEVGPGPGLLTRHLLQPVLGIADQRTDRRIDFVGGIRGMDELERRVDSGEAAVAFALFPTSLEHVMKVADAGKVMPPKSTWFEPKLRPEPSR